MEGKKKRQPRFVYQDMPEASSTESEDEVTEVWGCGNLPVPQIRMNLRPELVVGGHMWPRKLFLLANKIARDPGEAALGNRAELVIAVRFLAHHKFPAARARVEPHGIRGCGAVRAIEAYPRSQLGERASLRQLHRFFVFDSNPCRSHAAFLRTDRAHQNLVAIWSSTSQTPLSRRARNHSDERHERKNCNHKENFVR